MRISDWSSDVCSSDLASDPYLLDHRIDGRGVLPAAGAVEWMAQFVTAAWPGWHVVEMRDVRQMGGITLDPEVNDGKRSVLLRARASSHADHTEIGRAAWRERVCQ